MVELSAKQGRILKFLRDNPRWMARAEMEQSAGRKGFSKALGAPTKGPPKPGTLEALKYVKRRDELQPFIYRITSQGKEALLQYESNKRIAGTSNSLVTGYSEPLPERIVNFIEQMKGYGFEFYASGPKCKTINIRRGDRKRCGYINDTVKYKDEKSGILGYNFAPFGEDKNSCPDGLVPRMKKLFSERYKCAEGDFSYYEHPSGANRGNWYLVITEPNLAKQVLLHDAEVNSEISSNDLVDSTAIELPGRHAGAGFGNAADNKIVENAAVEAVKRCYVSDGWTVRSVERDKCGFDLECRKGKVLENVEVKGVRGTEPSFFITSNEVNSARTNPNFVLIVVTSALSASPAFARFAGVEFCRNFDCSPVLYRAALRR